MPELPEVEVVRRGLETEIQETPYLLGFEFRRANIRNFIPQEKLHSLAGEKIQSVQRRAKYLLFKTESAGFLSHLGMSGSWRLETHGVFQTHDHILMKLGRHPDDSPVKTLVYRDPRRFGIFDFWQGELSDLRWGGDLAPEPLSAEFNADRFFAQTRHKQKPIKSFIMDQSQVVGVGNIYASESLFLAGIRPTRAAKKLTQAECQKLVKSIKNVLQRAISVGGSTINDFKSFYGNPGDYHLQHFVYGRAEESCRHCKASQIQNPEWTVDILVSQLPTLGKSCGFCSTLRTTKSCRYTNTLFE